MSLRAALPLAFVALTACVPLQDAADQIAREQARTYVNQEVERRFPGVDARVVTDCVINNASAQEIITIAGGIALGNTDAASNTLNQVLQRPSTIQCTASGARSPLLGTGQSILQGLL